MKIKVSEAEGVVLDWLVAKAQGISDQTITFAASQRTTNRFAFVDAEGRTTTCSNAVALFDMAGGAGNMYYSPPTNWSQGGPIIEREMITVGPAEHEGFMAWGWPKAAGYWGDSPLIAAMRCYVISKLGDEVDVPDELLRPETSASGSIKA